MGKELKIFDSVIENIEWKTHLKWIWGDDATMKIMDGVSSLLVVGVCGSSFTVIGKVEESSTLDRKNINKMRTRLRLMCSDGNYACNLQQKEKLKLSFMMASL